jgi:hypothetical protein
MSFARPFIAWFVLGLGAIGALSACTDTESATNLHTSGPPTIEQIRLDEQYTDAQGAKSQRRVFAFGTHPQAKDPDDEHHVTAAIATKVSLRIIIGKLLQGNSLQQVQCRAPVALDANGQPTAFANVPVGATPDDIARCSVTSDVLPQTCTGSLAVCLCQIPTGCGTLSAGQPVGVLDANHDGAADNMQFTPGAAGIKCTSAIGTIDVPINLAASYWNPSGFQQVPAMGGFDALGPAIVLVPASVGGTAMLPTNMTCGLTFAPNVVDKTNTQLCAPANGHPAACAGINLDQCGAAQGDTCTPGDVSAFTFGTQALALASFVNNGDVGVSRTDDVNVTANAPLDAASIASVQVKQGTTAYTQFTVTLDAMNPLLMRIHWTNATGLAAMTQYTITFPTAITDFYHQPLPAPLTVSFTTGA